MKWYTNTDKPELDYSKPICATSECGEYKYILLISNHDKDSYSKGYDWFNFTCGQWNSCKHWKTAQDAVNEYSERGYTISNCEITIV